jgi:hypothetical protein
MTKGERYGMIKGEGYGMANGGGWRMTGLRRLRSSVAKTNPVSFLERRLLCPPIRRDKPR